MALAGLVAAGGLAPRAGSAQSSVTLEEVVVTAQKRDQSLQDVPMAVTAVGEVLLEKVSAAGFVDYARLVPGVSFDYTGAGGGQYGEMPVFIRGISSSRGALSTMSGAPVGFYINETPVSFSNPNLFDVSRVEVLRGPQGTLYGAGAMGGAIKLVTNQPDTSRLQGVASADVATTRHGAQNGEIRGMINVPLVEDRIALRLTAATKREDGFIDNVGRPLNCATPSAACEVAADAPAGTAARKNYNDVEQTTVRGAVKFELTDNLSVTPSVLYDSIETGGDSTLSGLRRTNGEGQDVFGLTTHMLIPTPETGKLTLSDLTIAYSTGFGDLSSSTSYSEWKSTDIIDLSFLFRNVMKSIFTDPDSIARADDITVPFHSAVDRESFTQEVRFSSPTGGRFNWVVGGFYSAEDIVATSSSISSVIADDPQFSSVVPGGLVVTLRNAEEARQFALFGEASVDITDRLSVTGGLRWFDGEIESTRMQDGFLAGGFQNPTLRPQSESSTSPKVTVNYRVTDDHLLYGVISKGFRAGGTQAPATNPGCDAELAGYGYAQSPDTFDSDSLWNYEVGAKTSWAGQRLVLNTSAYWMNWTDIQQTLFLSCGATILVNAGAVASKGVEVELQARPTESIELYANLSFNDAKLTEDNQVGVGKKGDYVLNAPRFKSAVGAEYSKPMFGDAVGFLRADYQYSTAAYTSFTPLANAVRMQRRNSAEYHMVALRAGLSIGPWNVAVYVQNLLDERPLYFANAPSFGTQFTQFTTTRPRTIGLMLKRHFDF